MITNKACLPVISLGFSRSCLIPARIVLEWSPKLTMSFTSFFEPSTSATDSIVPTRMSSFYRSSNVTSGFTGAGFICHSISLANNLQQTELKISVYASSLHDIIQPIPAAFLVSTPKAVFLVRSIAHWLFFRLAATAERIVVRVGKTCF